MPGYGDVDIKKNSKFLKIEQGDPQRLRLLNPEPLERWEHMWPPQAKKLPELCQGAKCPHCATKNEPKQRWVTNVYSHTREKIFIYKYGPQVSEFIRDIAIGLREDNLSINDFDLKIEAKGSGMNTKYSVTLLAVSKPVPAGLELHDLNGDGKVLETAGEPEPLVEPEPPVAPSGPAAEDDIPF